MPKFDYDRSKGKSAVDERVLTRKISRSNEILEKLRSKADRSVIAFSGGKDSIVAAHLATKTGITSAVCEESFVCNEQKADFRKIAQELGLSCAFQEILSYGWLARNPKWLFPSIKIQGQFYAMRQQASVKRYAAKNGYEGIVYGRRTEENTVPSELYQLKSGVWQCHPLRDWTTSEVWYYIHYHDLSYPRIYDHEIGQKEGNTPLTILPPEHFVNPWKTMAEYAPEIARKIIEAGGKPSRP